MNTTAAEAGETLVAASVAVAVSELAPAVRVTLAVHAPLVAWAVTEASSVEPLSTFTVEPASAVPDSDSEADLVDAAAVEMVGAAGAMPSETLKDAMSAKALSVVSSMLPPEYDSVTDGFVLASIPLSVSVAADATFDVLMEEIWVAPVAVPASVPDTVQPVGALPESSLTFSLNVRSIVVSVVAFADKSLGARFCVAVTCWPASALFAASAMSPTDAAYDTVTVPSGSLKSPSSPSVVELDRVMAGFEFATLFGGRPEPPSTQVVEASVEVPETGSLKVIVILSITRDSAVSITGAMPSDGFAE